MHKIVGLPAPPPLADFAASGPVALFLDFDGTLVDIAATPGGIDIPADLAHRLDALSHQLAGRMALVSGRSFDDIDDHLGPLAAMIVGSHGAEFGRAAPPDAMLSKASRAAVAALADRWPALIVETKPLGLAIHYRQEPDAAPTVLSAMDDIARREGLAARRGKMVVELGPPGVSKGAAVARLMAQPPFADAVPIFVGDDITDEDGFAAVAKAGGHGILVGDARPTAARYRLADTAEVHRWLTL